jgi:hypothetical protein
MAENPNFGAARHGGKIVIDAEKAWNAQSEHEETVSAN